MENSNAPLQPWQPIFGWSNIIVRREVEKDDAFGMLYIYAYRCNTTWERGTTKDTNERPDRIILHHVYIWSQKRDCSFCHNPFFRSTFVVPIRSAEYTLCILHIFSKWENSMKCNIYWNIWCFRTMRKVPNDMLARLEFMSQGRKNCFRLFGENKYLLNVFNILLTEHSCGREAEELVLVCGFPYRFLSLIILYSVSRYLVENIKGIFIKTANILIHVCSSVLRLQLE